MGQVQLDPNAGSVRRERRRHDKLEGPKERILVLLAVVLFLKDCIDLLDCRILNIYFKREYLSDHLGVEWLQVLEGLASRPAEGEEVAKNARGVRGVVPIACGILFIPEGLEEAFTRLLAEAEVPRDLVARPTSVDHVMRPVMGRHDQVALLLDDVVGRDLQSLDEVLGELEVSSRKVVQVEVVVGFAVEALGEILWVDDVVGDEADEDFFQQPPAPKVLARRGGGARSSEGVRDALMGEDVDAC